MTIPSQERVRPIELTLTFRDVSESHLLPMSQYADHSRRAQILIQMVDGSETREERTYRYRSVFGASAMKAENIVAALEGDPIISGTYKVIYTIRSSEQGGDLVTLAYNPPSNTPL